MKEVNRAIAEGWDQHRVDYELAGILRALLRDERLASQNKNIGGAALDDIAKVEIINEWPDQDNGLEAA